MQYIVPFGLSGPNSILTPDQELILYRTHHPVEWMVMMTLMLWQVVTFERGTYVRECVEAELGQAFLDNLEDKHYADDPEYGAAYSYIQDHFDQLVNMVYDIQSRLFPYIGTIPCRPGENVQECFEVRPLGTTAMIIDLRYENEDGEPI